MSTLDPHQPLGLRARKKAATMRRIQHVALDLFREHGFDQVRIEQVAEVAEVSPSTVYRYFGTKEGLVLRDEFDEQILHAMATHLTDGHDPWAAMGLALAANGPAHFVIQEAESLERFGLWMTTPSIQAAAHLMIDEIVDAVARLMAETGRWSFGQGRVIASAMLWPILAALRNWHDEGASRPWIDYVAEALTALGRDDVLTVIEREMVSADRPPEP